MAHEPGDDSAVSRLGRENGGGDPSGGDSAELPPPDGEAPGDGRRAAPKRIEGVPMDMAMAAEGILQAHGEL